MFVQWEAMPADDGGREEEKGEAKEEAPGEDDCNFDLLDKVQVNPRGGSECVVECRVRLDRVIPLVTRVHVGRHFQFLTVTGVRLHCVSVARRRKNFSWESFVNLLSNSLNVGFAAAMPLGDTARRARLHAP